MAAQAVDPEKVAAALTQAELLGDAAAAKNAGVTVRTIERWRALSATDEKISAAVAEKRKLAVAELGRLMIAALNTGVLKMIELMSAAKPGEPGVLREVAGAVKILTDAQVLREAAGLDGEQPQRPESSTKSTPPPGGIPPAEGESASPVH